MTEQYPEVASMSPKISMDDTHIPLPPGCCQFELTVVGATDLCQTHMWSPSQGVYVTVAVHETLIHKTRDIVGEEDPKWNDTFQFFAKRDDDLTISVYAASGVNTCLGKIEVSLEKADCTGEEMSRELSTMQTATPFKLKFYFERRSRLFGLIIGINKYQSDRIPNLQGCKADAQSIVDLLSQKSHIRSSHFLCLADERATRSAIIDGFQHHLIENDNVEHGDVIIIYYAGHGSRAAAPNGWVADDNMAETICPHDERTYDHSGEEIFGIPDRTICGLLRKLCKFKGENITMICDSCHSGGNSRTSQVARLACGASPLPEELDKNIWAWGLPLAAKSKGFLDNTMLSHVHLAACGPKELAFEDEGTIRGAFTHGLVNFLTQKEDLTKITYSSLLKQLPRLANQNPQCSGKNRHRALFGGLANRLTLLELSTLGGKYRTEAGEIHGVVLGTPFAIYALSDSTSTSSEIGVLEADSVSPFHCTLRRRAMDKKFIIPELARAVMLDWRPDADVLKVFVEPPHDSGVKSIEGIFSLVNHSGSPDLMILCTSSGTWRFERLDPIISKYAQMLDGISPMPGPSLSDVLKRISHFNFHLSRRNTKQPLQHPVQVVFHRLTQSNPDQFAEETIYMPDGDTGISLTPDSETTVFATNEADGDCAFYGLSITNNSKRHLFPYLIYFDPSDYSIQSWYLPPAPTMAAPLRTRNANNEPPPDLKVGYGEANAKAIWFSLPDGINTDVTFLRLFVSTTYVDMSALEQLSPFLNARGGAMGVPPSMPIWDAWTYVFRTVRQ